MQWGLVVLRVAQVAVVYWFIYRVAKAVSEDAASAASSAKDSEEGHCRPER